MIRKIAIIAILLLGVGIIAYPFFSDYFNTINGSHTIDTYQSELDQKDEEEIAAAFKRAQEYNESLLGKPLRDPFLEGSGIVMQSDYYEILNVGGTMGYVEIPKISVRLPLYHGTSESVLKKGVGHLEGSTLPIGGAGTHAVLTGHTGLPYAKLFTDLTAVKIGDLFFIHVLDRTLAYKVDDIEIIEPQKTTELKPYEGKDYCSLLTCTPYGVNSHRLVVRGIRTEYRPEDIAKEALSKSPSAADRMVLLAAVVTTSVMLLLILFALMVKRRLNRRHAENPKESL